MPAGSVRETDPTGQAVAPPDGGESGRSVNVTKPHSRAVRVVAGSGWVRLIVKDAEAHASNEFIVPERPRPAPRSGDRHNPAAPYLSARRQGAPPEFAKQTASFDFRTMHREIGAHSLVRAPFRRHDRCEVRFATPSITQ